MKGNILRIKQGYNPNSSSMGSIIFALPVSLVAVSFSLAAASGFILPLFIRDAGASTAEPSNQEKTEGSNRAE